MSLSFSESLREARSIACFSGEDNYLLSSFLRDVGIVLSLTNAEYQPAVQVILMNKLRGKALYCIETLINLTYDEVITKLKEEFGVKKSFLYLRNEAMNVRAKSIEELTNKLANILQQMNTKFNLNDNIDMLYTPSNNEKLIFDIYLTFLPLHLKTLLIQNDISSINKSYSYMLENNILNFTLSGCSANVPTVQQHNRNNHAIPAQPRSMQGNFRNSGSGELNNFSNAKSFNSNRNFYNNNNSGRYKNVTQQQNSNQPRNYNNPFRQTKYEQHNTQRHQAVEPMEVGNVERFENFRFSPDPPTYQ